MGKQADDENNNREDKSEDEDKGVIDVMNLRNCLEHFN